MFFCEFCKIFKKIFSFDRTPLDDCLLCLSLNLRSLSNSFFYKAPLGNCLFHVQFAEFQPPDTEKSISQVLFKHLYKNEKQPFEGFHLPKSLETVKGNAQFVQKVTFEPSMDFKQNHYGCWKYYKSCYFEKLSSPKLQKKDIVAFKGFLHLSYKKTHSYFFCGSAF